MHPRVFIKQFLPRSLFGRSLLIIVMPLILLQIVSTWIFFDRHWDTITRRLANSISGDIALIVEEMRRDPSAARRTQLFELARAHMGLEMVYSPGEILPNTEIEYGGILDKTLAFSLYERVQKPFQIDTSSFKTEVIIDIQLPKAVLTVVAPGKRLFSSTTYIFVLWMVGTSLVLFAVASIFMRNQVRPIRRLAAAADGFGKGREIRDFKIEGATEVRLAATAFNRMRERISRQMRQRTDMLSGVSHDLRTPLTRMNLQLAMLGDGPEVAELKADVAEMEKMIEGYLTFARGEGDEQAVETDLAALIADAVSAWKRNGAEIDLHIEGQFHMLLKPNAFGRCLDNLIANGGRYGSHVWVRAGRRGDGIEITVEDDGPGIPIEERENVFRPFYRLDRSRNPETGGTGLGLAIARDVARAHGGEIEIEDSPHGGVRARISLPL